MKDDPQLVNDEQLKLREENPATATATDGTNVTIDLLAIDTAIINHLQKKIRPVVTQGGEQVPVPVIYGDPERWKSAQADGVYRDTMGKIQLPLIMIRRTGMAKAKWNSPVNKHLDRTFRAGWNRRNPYDRFAVTNGITPSQEYYTIRSIPDYYMITYRCIVWTEYMAQMNGVVENISFESDEFWGEPNGYKFRAGIKRFDTATQLPSSADRVVRTQFELSVHAYLLPVSQLDANGNRVIITRRTYGTKKTVVFTEIDDG